MAPKFSPPEAVIHSILGPGQQADERPLREAQLLGALSSVAVQCTSQERCGLCPQRVVAVTAALREGEVREVEIALRDKAYLTVLVPSLDPFIGISLLYDLQPLALCDGQLVLTSCLGPIKKNSGLAVP